MEKSGEPESWDVASTIRLAKLLPALGVDLLEVSSGGNDERQSFAPFDNDYQGNIAGRIRSALYEAGIKELVIGAVERITEAEAAKSIVQNSHNVPREQIEIENEHGQTTKADVVLVARQFLREPEWVFRVAYILGVEVQWPGAVARCSIRDASS
jgi:2,4-dienoyl-CoA reductase-like NADH-dependent reductase (Old Yellow Enzyme family)